MIAAATTGGEHTAMPAKPSKSTPSAPVLARAAASVVPVKPQRGRPPVDTVSINLRMPVEMAERIAVEAGRRAIAQRRNVTSQAVILAALEQTIPPLDSSH
jgi:hypothetical protein